MANVERDLLLAGYRVSSAVNIPWESSLKELFGRVERAEISRGNYLYLWTNSVHHKCIYGPSQCTTCSWAVPLKKNTGVSPAESEGGSEPCEDFFVCAKI